MTKVEKEQEQVVLETRKVKALEKIDKQEWSDRIQWYLSEYYETSIKPNKPTE